MFVLAQECSFELLLLISENYSMMAVEMIVSDFFI